jgi:hypothetical protein
MIAYLKTIVLPRLTTVDCCESTFYPSCGGTRPQCERSPCDQWGHVLLTPQLSYRSTFTYAGRPATCIPAHFGGWLFTLDQLSIYVKGIQAKTPDGDQIDTPYAMNHWFKAFILQKYPKYPLPTYFRPFGVVNLPDGRLGVLFKVQKRPLGDDPIDWTLKPKEEPFWGSLEKNLKGIFPDESKRPVYVTGVRGTTIRLE